MILVSIDPGIAETAAAVWDLSKLSWVGGVPRAHDVEMAATALLGTGMVRTKPAVPIPDRLNTIYQWTRGQVLEAILHEPAADVVVCIEEPAHGGEYRRQGGMKNRAAVNKLLLATGAIAAASAECCGATHLVIAGGTRLDIKVKVAQRLFEARWPSQKLPHGDILDAIYFGFSCIQRTVWTK